MELVGDVCDKYLCTPQAQLKPKTQTVALLPFDGVFAVQLDSPENTDPLKNVYHVIHVDDLL